MRLTDLEAGFYRYERRPEGEFHVPVERIEDAQGVRFLCPKCFQANGGAVGTHSVVCWSATRGVPPEAQPGPGRWGLAGTGLADLSLVPDVAGQAHSVQLNGGCQWHGFVTNGDAA